MEYMKRREDEMKQTVVSLICMDMRDESRRTWYETENGTSSTKRIRKRQRHTLLLTVIGSYSVTPPGSQCPLLPGPPHPTVIVSHRQPLGCDEQVRRRTGRKSASMCGRATARHCWGGGVAVVGVGGKKEAVTRPGKGLGGGSSQTKKVVVGVALR